MGESFETWQMFFFLTNVGILVAEVAILLRPSNRWKMKWNVKRIILLISIIASTLNVLWFLDPHITARGTTVLQAEGGSIFGVRWSHAAETALYYTAAQLLVLCFVLLVLYYRKTAEQFEAASPCDKGASMRAMLRQAVALVGLNVLVTVPFVVLEEGGDSARKASQAGEEGSIVSLLFVLGLAVAGELYARRIDRSDAGTRNRALAVFARKVRRVCRLGLMAMLALAACFCWRWLYIEHLPHSQLAGSAPCRGEGGGTADVAWCKNYFALMWCISLIETAMYVLLLTAISPNTYKYMRRAAARLSAIAGISEGDGQGTFLNWSGKAAGQRDRGSSNAARSSTVSSRSSDGSAGSRVKDSSVGGISGGIDWARVRAGYRRERDSKPRDSDQWSGSNADEALLEVEASPGVASTRLDSRAGAPALSMPGSVRESTVMVENPAFDFDVNDGSDDVKEEEQQPHLQGEAEDHEDKHEPATKYSLMRGE